MAMAKETIDRLDERRQAFAELTPWIEGGLKLQKAEGSAFQRLKAAGAVALLAPRGEPAWVNFGNESATTIQIFVVQHNWAEAFKGATDFDAGDYQFPFDRCCFEFRISGKRVCAVCEVLDGDKHITVLVETASCWAVPVCPFFLSEGMWLPTDLEGEDAFWELPEFVAAHIRAVCISLEAEVAAPETVEIPEKLNAARIRRGKAPLPEYSVVRLNRRPRARTIPGEPGTKKRLHFRRGHWRHLGEDRKTWIRWCLVGDPELGFLDKEYRL